MDLDLSRHRSPLNCTREGARTCEPADHLSAKNPAIAPTNVRSPGPTGSAYLPPQL